MIDDIVVAVDNHFINDDDDSDDRIRLLAIINVAIVIYYVVCVLCVCYTHTHTQTHDVITKKRTFDLYTTFLTKQKKFNPISLVSITSFSSGECFIFLILYVIIIIIYKSSYVN